MQLNDEMTSALKVQEALRDIGVESKIVTRGYMTVVTGMGRDGKPFNIRIRHCSTAADLEAFADDCNAERAAQGRPPLDAIILA